MLQSAHELIGTGTSDMFTPAVVPSAVCWYGQQNAMWVDLFMLTARHRLVRILMKQALICVKVHSTCRPDEATAL